MRDFTLIYGCMFSGKTTRLIGLYNESEIDINERLVVKPVIDNRYSDNAVHSHGGLQVIGHRLFKAEEIYPLVTPQTREIYIDEVQFFGPFIVEIIGELMSNGIKVFAAGLDKDYLNQDFGPMRALKNLSNNHIQLLAKCNVCGKEATHTFRTVQTEDLVLVGHSDMYQARCKEHWEEGMKIKSD
jgi:thymidine kinase